jgi:hypothetical protein
MDVNGVYKPTYNWGAPHCDHFPYEVVIFMGIPHESTSVTRRHRRAPGMCRAAPPPENVDKRQGKKHIEQHKL